MKALRLALAFALLGMIAPASIAGECGVSAVAPSCGSAAADGCCDPCGNGGCCGVQKVCRLVKTTDLITVVCWGCKTKEICIPCRSTKGCTHEESVKTGACSCDGCDKGGNCCVRWTDWCPGGAKQKCVKQLVKYEVTKEVCSWKWEVVEVCGNGCGNGCCGNGCGAGCGNGCGAVVEPGCGCASAKSASNTQLASFQK